MVRKIDRQRGCNCRNVFYQFSTSEIERKEYRCILWDLCLIKLKFYQFFTIKKSPKNTLKILESSWSHEQTSSTNRYTFGRFRIISQSTD